MARTRFIQEAVNASLQQFEVFRQGSICRQTDLRRHSCTMFIRGKPIRFGFRNWLLVSSCGYPFRFETSVGATDMRRDQPLDPYIVSNLLLITENPRQPCVCFDNFFIPYQLLVDLKVKQFRALGTIRENRFLKCLVPYLKAVQKKTGFYDCYFDKNVVWSNGMTIELYIWHGTFW